MADEQNPGQQPEQSEGIKRVQALKSKCDELGFDLNLFFDMMGGVAQNAVKSSQQEISGLVEMKVKTLGDNLAGQIKANNDSLRLELSPLVAFVKDIQSQVSQVQQPAQMQQPVGNAMVPMGGEIPPGQGLMQGSGGKPGFGDIIQLLKMFGMGGNSGEQPGNGGLSQMATLAKSWGEVMRAMMEPVVEMQTTMRQSLLSEMQTYSRTGGTLPWEADEPAPASTARLTNSRQQRPAQRPVVLNQEIDDSPSDYSKEAAELAKRFKFA
ncbi:MAG: hypothetical protein WC364_14970 [Eubacteriales bacterium]|jgi:hypothetical protein